MESHTRTRETRARIARRAAFYSIPLALALATGTAIGDATPPKPKRMSHTREIHGRTLVDDYFWLRERKDPRVLEHLKAENAYTSAMTAHLKPLEDRLYSEFLSRIQQTDLSVPYLDNGYFYYSRTVEGKSYPIYCRKKGSLGASEEVMLDVNALAEGKPTIFAGPLAVSPDCSLLAYYEDPTGGRRLTIRFRNLETGTLLPDTIENAVRVVRRQSDVCIHAARSRGPLLPVHAWPARRWRGEGRASV
jgi:oligopeptidase B